MDSHVRIQLDMADKVLVFNAAHPPTDAGTQVVFDELTAEVSHAKDLASGQLSGRTAARSATSRRKQLKAELQGGLLRYLVRVGQAATQELPELAERFQLPNLGDSNRG